MRLNNRRISWIVSGISRESTLPVGPLFRVLVDQEQERGRGHGLSTTPGLGIGLALSKALVEQHGGTLSCHSSLGEGTVFTLTLPLAASHEAVPAGGGGRSGADGARTQIVVGGAGASAMPPVE